MKILFATGGSPHSETARRFCAIALKPLLEQYGTLTILTVVRPGQLLSHAQHILDETCQQLAWQNGRVQSTVRIGHPAEEIIAEAAQGEYDLVVVGDRQQHSLMTRFLLGSTARRVVEDAPCPVIIAKGTITPIRRMLVCDSGIEQPALLDRLARQLGQLFGGNEQVTILHVMSQISAGPGVGGQQLRASAEELMAAHAPEGRLLAQDLDTLARLNIRPALKVRHGLVVDEILAEVAGNGYDMLVIGAHRGEGWQRILLDDLAQRVITHVDRPVLVIR